MIYLDNAATGGFKPRAVYDAMTTVARYLSANPGRSGHRLSVTGAKIVWSCRELLADFFNCSPERAVFTKNCTEAINTAIFGTLKKNKKVITTTFEHNSVLRPLTHLKDEGLISLDIVAPTDGKPLPLCIKEKMTPDVYLVIATAVSNVTGEHMPIKRIGELCKSRGVLFLVDGAQGGGHVSLNMKENNIDMLALAGHKGLYGITGSGALLLSDNVDVSPLIYGGTGTESHSLSQPENYPERLESGTLNLPAIAALCEGMRYVKKNFDNFGELLYKTTAETISALENIQGVRCYSRPNRSGIISFSINGKDSMTAADILNTDYDVAVRGGLHCAPLTHEYLKTAPDGLVRASLSVQNSAGETDCFLRAVKAMANA